MKIGWKFEQKKGKRRKLIKNHEKMYKSIWKFNQDIEKNRWKLDKTMTKMRKKIQKIDKSYEKNVWELVKIEQ